MSFLESGKERFAWIAAPARTSLLPEPGCVQCGRLLDAELYKLNHSGKCLNCAGWVCEDDDTFDELED